MSLVDHAHRHWHRSEKLRFLVVGGWNTVFGYAVFVLLYWLAGGWLHYAIIATMAHFLAVTQSFIGQRTLVFPSATDPWSHQFLRFHVASLAALGINLGLLSLLVEVLHLYVPAAQALAMLLSIAVSYLLHKHYSFRETL
jgi:putative flippase GtrA